MKIGLLNFTRCQFLLRPELGNFAGGGGRRGTQRGGPTSGNFLKFESLCNQFFGNFDINLSNINFLNFFEGLKGALAKEGGLRGIPIGSEIC